MITVELARSLAAGGVLWQPAPGDRFTIDQPNVLGEVFWISHLTIDVHTFHGQPLLGFNGTTEWALDSVALEDALWHPLESQLRDLLGGTFRRLERTGDGYEVSTVVLDAAATWTGAEPADAYARALLALVAASVEDEP